MHIFPQRGIFRSLLHLFYPLTCEGCGRELSGDERTLCLYCIGRLPYTGLYNEPDNRVARCFIGRVPIVKATSFVYFTKQGLVQELLHRLKYKNKPEIGRLLGKLFALDMKKNGWTDNIDAIVPVPLHRKKEWRRGYNQSAVFAEGIASEAGIPVLMQALARTRNTATQTHKTRAERIGNVQHVFKADCDAVKGKHLLLVDDVLTTGATLEACAQALLRAPGVRVSIATLALATD